MQKIFNSIGKSSSYGSSTTHIAKLLPRIEGGGGGGCPILVFGITEKLYIED
ncbi:MAG: BglII/BstYI family type II restriction endonuclease [Rickettsia endosymbiont of Argas persicus]